VPPVRGEGGGSWGYLERVALSTEELVRRMYAALNRGDLDEFLSYLTEDFELQTLDALPDAGSYRGTEELIAWWERFREQFEEIAFEPTEFAEADDGTVVAKVSAQATGKASGIAGQLSFWTVWRVRAGKLAYTRHFSDREEAFRSAGLAAQSRRV
jgi:uncharacterized protein